MEEVGMDETMMNRITVDPNICHGKPCIRGMRYPVEVILELLSSGMNSEELLADYPDLEKADIDACLWYAARAVRTKSLMALAS